MIYEGENYPIFNVFKNKWFLICFLCFSSGFFWVFNQQWPSIYLILYPLFSCFGVFFFIFLSDFLHQSQIPSSNLKIIILGKPSLSIAILFVSTILQVLILGFFGLDSQNNSHLMQDYGVWYSILVILLYIFTWFILSWIILTFSQIELTLKDNLEVKIEKKVRIFGIKNEKILKIMIYLIIVFVLLAGLFIIDSLVINYSLIGIWKIDLFLPNKNTESNNFISISGFSYFLLILFPIIFILIFWFVIQEIKEKEFIGHIEKYMGLFDIEEAKKLLKEERTII